MNVKKNKTFQYLKVLLILMVIDDHACKRIDLLSNIFPYDSFFMPLFVFISGYFYKKQVVQENICNKFKRLLVPYIEWSLAGVTVAFVFEKMDIVYWNREINIYSIFRLCLDGPLSSIIDPMWFVVMLFWVSVVYNLIRKVIENDSLVFDYILLLICIALAMISLVLCMKGYYSYHWFVTDIFRLIFYFQFYHLGVMFHKYWEVIVKRWNKVVVCSLCILCNVVLICLYKEDIAFPSTSWMGSFHSWYLPLITSITGGLFWYEIMEFLSLKIGEVKWINFIADNTFTIMAVHLIFINIPNFFIYYRIKNGSVSYSDFDVLLFKEGAWYRYNNNMCLIGIMLSIIMSILVICIGKKIKGIIHNQFKMINFVK